MRLIAIEEHILPPMVREVWASAPPPHDPVSAVGDGGNNGARLADLGEGRLALMDEQGVDVQVLSLTTPGLPQPGARRRRRDGPPRQRPHREDVRAACRALPGLRRPSQVRSAGRAARAGARRSRARPQGCAPLRSHARHASRSSRSAPDTIDSKGYCNFKDKDGDSLYAEYTTDGAKPIKAITLSWTFKSGTGKYDGINGTAKDFNSANLDDEGAYQVHDGRCRRQDGRRLQDCAQRDQQQQRLRSAGALISSASTAPSRPARSAPWPRANPTAPDQPWWQSRSRPYR